jgi:Cu2+-exporting ATPase
LIEKLFSKQPGGLRIMIDIMHGDLRLEWTAGQMDLPAFARELQQFGYLIGPPEPRGRNQRERSGLEKRLGACGAFAMNAMAFSLPAYLGMPPDFAFASWFTVIAAASATLAMLMGGSYFIERAWKSLRAGVLHIDTPIALGIIAAYLGSLGGWIFAIEGLLYFDFVAIFIFLMLAGRWAQQSAVERNRRKLMRDTSIPTEVRTQEDAEDTLPIDQLETGTRFIVKPGQTLPVSSKLLSPAASVSLEWINGESDAQKRTEGQLLPAGVLNVGIQPITLEALENWEASALRRLLDARRENEYRDHALERLLRVYLAIVVIVGIAGAIGWWLSGAGIARGLQVMISIFVVSCPCALGVAIPLAEELASSRAERLGVFVRSLAFWKRLLRCRRIVFDKTGTLTLENPALKNPQQLQTLPPTATSALRRLVTGNLHPVSRSLFDALGPGPEAAGQVTEHIGQGLELLTPDHTIWRLGKPEWVAPENTGADVILAKNQNPIASFSFTDQLRADSIQEVQRLQQNGLQITILSGDRKEKVATIASTLNLSPADWQATLSPQQKADWIRQHQPDATLYIGDGANDSLAFDVALCSGSPITGRSFLEQKADFFFLGSSFRFLCGLIQTAATHRRAVRRVFAFSVSYNLFAAGLGLAGMLNPLLAAILMPLSSIATLTLVAFTFKSNLR